jgi:hypothetical protein
MKNFVFAVVLLTLAAASLDAQISRRVQSGTRVRLWLPEAQQQENGPWRRQLLRATVTNVSADSLQLEIPGITGSLSIAGNDIHRIDVSRGTSRVASAFDRAFGLAIVAAISVAIDNDPYAKSWPNYRRN